MDTGIQKQIEDWKYIQNLSLDILKLLSEEQLGLTVGKNMGTIGEQFRHMARVRFQYAEAIENRILSKTIEKIDPTVALSKTGLLELWDKANQKLLSVIEKSDLSIIIDWKYWGVGEMTLQDHLNALMDHETLHNGQLIIYLRTHDIQFPKSWEAWGL